MPSALDEALERYMKTTAELEAQPEPAAPQRSESFWEDLKNHIDYMGQKEAWAAQQAALKNPGSDQMKIAEITNKKNVSNLMDYMRKRNQKTKQEAANKKARSEIIESEYKPEYKKKIDKSKLRPPTDENYIDMINSNQFEEITGVPYEGRGQRFTYDGQDYVITGNIGDQLELKPVDYQPLGDILNFKPRGNK